MHAAPTAQSKKINQAHLPSSFLTNQLRRATKAEKIPALINNQDQLTTNPALIPEVAASFNSNLYPAPQSHTLDPFIHQINTYVEEFPTPDLQPIFDTLDEDLSQEGVAHTLKKAPHLSFPGPDMLP